MQMSDVKANLEAIYFEPPFLRFSEAWAVQIMPPKKGELICFNVRHTEIANSFCRISLSKHSKQTQDWQPTWTLTPAAGQEKVCFDFHATHDLWRAIEYSLRAQKR